MAVVQWAFTLGWLILGLLIGIKSLQKPTSLLMFVAMGCFLASIAAFLSAPLSLQIIVFIVGTIAILIIEEA